MKPIIAHFFLASTLAIGIPATTCLSAANAATTIKQSDSYKALLNVFAYDDQNKLLGSGTAFFINEKGEAACAYTIFQNAHHAEVVDFKGNRYTVSRILGANRDYDLIRFSVSGLKKFEFLPIASETCTDGSQLQLAHYTTNKKASAPIVSVTKREAYADLSYYTISAANDTDNFGAALVNERGELVGIVQKNVGKEAQTACAIDARFINKLEITTLSAFSPDLRSIHIQKALPAKAKDALTYLYMMPQADSASVCTAYADFINAYPNLADGYMGRASLFTNQHRYAEADADIKTALEKAANVQDSDSTLTIDNVHYQYSNLMSTTLNLQPDSAAAATQGWSYERALKEAETAYAIRPLPLYLTQQANCLVALKDYKNAYSKYLEATQNKGFASSETFYRAARALELSGGDEKDVVVLLDSAINLIPQPVSPRNAQYYLERSQRLLRLEKYRDAVMDYNEYEKAIGPRNLTAKFYFLRHEAEMEAHMYQQALDDIRTAISSSSQPLPYRLEEAYVLLRVGEFQQAIQAASKLLKDLPENPDCYRIIGIAYGELGKKALAQQNLQKAKALGDDSIDTFIQKYK